MKKILSLLGLGLLFWGSLLWATLYQFKYGYQEKGVIVTKIVRSTYLNTILKANKGRLERQYFQKEKQQFLDLILKIKNKKIMAVRRSYYKFTQVTKSLDEEKKRTALHFLTGTTWKIKRRGTRNIATQLTAAKIPKPAAKIVALDDNAAMITPYLPTKKVSPGYRWSLPVKISKKMLGDDWKPGVKTTFQCRFVRKVFYKGFQCAKIQLIQKAQGVHKMGIKATIEMQGYMYYSLEYGFPVYYKMTGKWKMKVKQVAPRGQTAYFKAYGPVSITISKEYRPPEIRDDDDE